MLLQKNAYEPVVRKIKEYHKNVFGYSLISLNVQYRTLRIYFEMHSAIISPHHVAKNYNLSHLQQSPAAIAAAIAAL